MRYKKGYTMKYPKSKNHINECVHNTQVETNMSVIEVALNGGKSPWVCDMEEVAKIRIVPQDAKALIANLELAIALIEDKYPELA